ncbi:MAG: hypothetical protein GX456_06900 [Verrucomicrobia bacterium]|nr:hypothetical protein [Verrucomicrobiota bacterium]
MTNGNNLLQNGERAGMVTPLVDVVFNLMITMFIFLMIYMAVVLPRSERPLRFASVQLPDAAPYQVYHTQVRVAHGSGDFRYEMVASGLRTNEAMLSLDRTNGLLTGVFLGPTSPFRTNAETINLRIVVIDRLMVATVPTNMVVFMKVGESNMPLFFHQEWPAPDVERLLKESRAESAPKRPNADRPSLMQRRQATADARPDSPPPATRSSGERPMQTNVLCHYAIRSNFTIAVLPAKVPFDPAKNPLRLPNSRETVKGVATFPIEIPISPLGGIEPYEYQATNMPPWLRLDERRALLIGTPPRAATNEFTILVKDAQTPARDWELAYRLKDTPGHPLVSAAIAIEVEEFKPLQATIALPRFGRVGEPIRGAVLVQGGFGRRRFSAQQLPPGLVLNPDSGEITGRPVEKTDLAIVVRVTDELTNSVLARATAPEWRGIIDRAPAARIIGTP